MKSQSRGRAFAWQVGRWAGAVILTVCGSASAGAAAKPFAQLFVFGDSTVDSGWYKVSPYSGSPKVDAYLSKSGTYKIGKPTNNPGPMSVEILGGLLKLDALPANQSGTNYATSGARNSMTNVPGSGFFPKAVPTITQIANYMKGHNPTADALYVVSSGGNDVRYAVTQVADHVWTNAAGQTYVKNAANALATKIAALQKAGAVHVIVGNLQQDFGPATDNTKAYRKLYNTTLQGKLKSLKVKYVVGDINGVRQKIIADTAHFHITNVSNMTPACKEPAASTGITSAWGLVCSASSPVSKPTAANPATTLFADNEHWTSTAHKILGSYYFCLAKKTWASLFTGWTKAPPYACSLFGL